MLEHREIAALAGAPFDVCLAWRELEEEAAKREQEHRAAWQALGNGGYQARKHPGCP